MFREELLMSGVLPKLRVFKVEGGFQIYRDTWDQFESQLSHAERVVTNGLRFEGDDD